jgi:signal transduction histidine kinase
VVRSETRAGRAARSSIPFTLSLLWAIVAGWVEWRIARSPSPAVAHLAVFATGWVLFTLILFRTYRRADRDSLERHAAQQARTRAERIAQLTDALSRARTPEAVIEAAVQEPLHALAADAAMFLIAARDDQPAHIARAVGYRGGERDARGAHALEGHTPAADAIGRGAPVVIESAAAYAREYPDYAATPAASGFNGIAAVPLLVGSRGVAVVQIEFRLGRQIAAEDRQYLTTLGVRAAQTLDRAWELQDAIRAREEADALRARTDEQLVERETIEQALRASETRYRSLAARTSRLHALAASLSEAVTLEAVAHAIVTHGRIVTGATAGEVATLIEDGTAFEILYSDFSGSGHDRPDRYPAEPGLCATHAIETREPILVSSFEEWQARYSRSAALAADGGFVSAAALPLLAEGRGIGVLSLYFTAPLNFDEEYRNLLISVAQHSAQALDRARLYESAQTAKSEAETANRLKDDFVSIISHELRTPLNAMLGWTALLRKGSIDDATVARALQSIHDNATRQARLVDELLDFSRLQSGRLVLEMETCDLRRLLRGVVEAVIPSAAARAIELVLAPVPAVQLRADPRRLEQVFFNVLGNALKFTENGGRVSIDATEDEESVEVRITDTGAGIEPGFLPYVFDRFRQEERPASRRYGGVGLGLSIARELVEAHGGRIAAESEGPGCGSTFVITLPLASPAPDERPQGNPNLPQRSPSIH